MENLEKNKTELTDKDLGLETEPKKTVTKETSKSVKKTNDALKNAAATAALKAAIDANNEISEKEAERTYIKEKMNFMLDKCKHDEVVEFRGDKIYAQYFGKIYSYTYNGIPVGTHSSPTTALSEGWHQIKWIFIFNHSPLPHTETHSLFSQDSVL